MDLKTFLHSWLPEQHQKVTREALRRPTPELLASLSTLETIDFEFSVNGFALQFNQNRFTPLKAPTPARRLAIQSDTDFLESLLPKVINLQPSTETSPTWFHPRTFIEALQHESLAFSFAVIGGPFETTAPIEVVLGRAAANTDAPKPEFHADLRWADIESVRAGTLRWTDLLLGRLQIKGEMSGFFRLSMKLMELSNNAR